MLDVLRDTTEAFRHHRVRHALCDALALAFFAPARAFRDLTFVCAADQHDDIVEALRRAKLLPRTTRPRRLTYVDLPSSTEVTVRLGRSDPDLSAAAAALAAECLGVHVPLVRPEYVLWMFCRDGRLQDHADALAMLQGGRVDLPRLRCFLAAARDAWADDQLSILQLRAKQEADRGDYSASVARRLVVCGTS